ncbi:MAG: type VI secretion system tube protein Hcp [Pirellulales bacterium]|jgi:type VI protein secretion system component Hcp
MILMKIANGSQPINGDCEIQGFSQYFTCESVGFGIAREVADSAKAGTSDIVFGVGELQEVSVSKSMDCGSPLLAMMAMRGATVGDVDIKFIEVSSDSSNATIAVVFLQIHLKTAFIKTWSISGDADGRPTEELTFWYNGIAFTWYRAVEGAQGKQYVKVTPEFAWDHVKNKPWSEGGSKLPAANSDQQLVKTG